MSIKLYPRPPRDTKKKQQASNILGNIIHKMVIALEIQIITIPILISINEQTLQIAINNHHLFGVFNDITA